MISAQRGAVGLPARATILIVVAMLASCKANVRISTGPGASTQPLSTSADGIEVYSQAPARPFSRLSRISVANPDGTLESGIGLLRERARAAGADAVIDISQGGSQISGTMIRYARR